MAQLDYRPNNAARALGTATDPDARRGRHRRHPVRAERWRSPRWPAAARDVGRWLSTAYADADDEASVEAARLARARRRASTASCSWRRTRGPGTPLLARAPDVPIVIMHGGAGGPAGRGRGARGRAPGRPRPSADRTARRPDRLARGDVAPSRVRRRSGRPRAGARAELGRRLVGRGRAPRSAPRSPRRSAPPDGPTAVVVANDQMALGLMTALRAHGRRRAAATSASPASTTTRTPAYYRPGADDRPARRGRRGPPLRGRGVRRRRRRDAGAARARRPVIDRARPR